MGAFFLFARTSSTFQIPYLMISLEYREHSYLIIAYLSLLYVCDDRIYQPKTMGGRKRHNQLTFIICPRGNSRQELKPGAWGTAAFCFSPPGLLSLLSFTMQAHIPRGVSSAVLPEPFTKTMALPELRFPLPRYVQAWVNCLNFSYYFY